MATTNSPYHFHVHYGSLSSGGSTAGTIHPGLGGSTIWSVLFRSLYNACSNVVGLFGLSLPEFVFGILGLALVFVIWHIVQRWRGKSKWSIHPVRSDVGDKVESGGMVLQ